VASQRLRDLVRRALGIVRPAGDPRPTADGPTLRAVVAARLPTGAATVAVLAPAHSGLPDELRRKRPKGRVHHLTAPGADAHVRLTACGPFDLIVDCLGKRGNRERFLACFYHLRSGGVMIVANGSAELAKPRPGHLGGLLSDALASRGEPHPGRQRGTPTAAIDAHGLGRALASVAAIGRHLVTERAELSVLAKMREPEMNAYLAALPDGRDRVLEVIAAQPFRSRCAFQENVETPRPNFPDHYDTIDLSLRVYHDVVMTPGQVLSTDRVITPDSYRHNQFRRLRNRYTDEIAPRFATLRHGTAELRYLQGTYLHLDNEVRGHFGHLMTEQMSRFWTWKRARARYPGLKAVVALNKGHELRGWESEMYAAAGIETHDLVFLREPVRVERMVSGTPMLSNPDYVHPAIVDTWREVGDRLVAGRPARDFPTRFFCSRRLAKRSCHNTEAVEAIFDEYGFSIVFPEDYSLGEQVQLFRGAEVIGGFVGSGLFSLCYAMDPKRVITVGSTAYTARNEYLIASVLGHSMNSIACVPDDLTFYQSPFTFEEKDADYLRELLTSL